MDTGSLFYCTVENLCKNTESMICFGGIEAVRAASTCFLAESCHGLGSMWNQSIVRVAARLPKMFCSLRHRPELVSWYSFCSEAVMVLMPMLH
jgi:hypothetical protein